MTCSRTSRVARALGTWALGLCAASVARAHGGPPIIEAALAHDDAGPLVVELSEGFAVRADEGSWAFLCPALFGFDLPPPSASLAGEAWLAGANDLYRIGPSRAPIAAGHPELAGSRVLSMAALESRDDHEGALLVLRIAEGDGGAAGTELVRIEIDGDRTETVLASPEIWTALTVLPASSTQAAQLWLARPEVDGVQLLALSEDGMLLDRQLALVPIEPLSLRLSTAGEHVFLHIVENGGNTLLHVATRGEPGITPEEVVRAALPVRGPALRGGEILLTHDAELLSWTREDGVMPSTSPLGAAPLTCLTPELACTERALYDAGRVEQAGFEGADMLLDLAHLAGPVLKPDDEALRQQCDLQWVVFRADLIRTGVMTLGEPEPPMPDAGPDAGTEAGGDAGTGGGGEPDASGDAGAAPRASNGCSVRATSSAGGSLVLWVWLALALCLRLARLSS